MTSTGILCSPTVRMKSTSGSAFRSGKCATSRPITERKNYLGEQGRLADLSWTAQDDRRGEPSREPTIDRLECPAAKRGKLGDRLAAPPEVAIPDDGLQARCQKLEQRELFHECRLFTNNKG